MPFTVEAAASDWQASTPPSTGWRPVSLPDDWSGHWPGHDGVVWYRITWSQSAADIPLGVTTDYWNMAAAVWINGSPLWSDQSLVEPLTRSWNRPHYWHLSPPLLRAGDNVLLIRVSGDAAYQPGLGEVYIGTPKAAHGRYDQAVWLRRYLQLVGLSVSAALGVFFLALWLMRRRDAVYGWFTLICVIWLLYGSNQLATSPWPFPTTDSYQRASVFLLLAFCLGYAMFLLRFAEQVRRRLEVGMATLLLVSAVAIAFSGPGVFPVVREAVQLCSALAFFVSSIAFSIFAWRARRVDCRILSTCIVVFLLPLVSDVLNLLGVLHSNVYYSAYCSTLLTISMAFVLAWRFSSSLRRIERFTDEQARHIKDVQEELSRTFERKYELEVTNARLSERLRLAQDLHDGFGGTLVRTIASLEHAPESLPASRFLSVLKELRDDLRVVIDVASRPQPQHTPLEELISSLRHRMTSIFDNQHIVSRWEMSGIDDCLVPGFKGMDVVLILQECLINVLRHSGAAHVTISLAVNADALTLIVTDDGHGFDPRTLGKPGHGIGLQSMRVRAARLGGTLDLLSSSAGTEIHARLFIGPSAGVVPAI